MIPIIQLPRFKNYTYLFLIGLFALTACKKNGTPAPKPTPVKSDTTITAIDSNVYFIGTVTGNYPNNSTVPTFWKYGAANLIPNDLSTFGSTPYGIALNGTDVYMAGATHLGVYEIATIWKNGVASLLATTAAGSIAQAITVNNNTVFTAGWQTVSNGSQQATSWANGIPTSVTPDNSTTSSNAFAIAIDGSDVYMAGFIFDSYKKYSEAVYWKNGTETILSTSQFSSQANAIAVSGGNVYVAGYINGVATLWTNGVAVPLTNSPLTSMANAIAISGSDVYVSGYVNGAAAYWKNGVMTTLQGSQTGLPFGVVANAIAINGTDLYVGGGYDPLGNTIYWKNGTAIKLTKGLGIIFGIAVVPH